MTDIEAIALKPQPRPSIVFTKAVHILDKKSRNGYISFPDARSALSGTFRLNYKEMNDFLGELAKMGLVEWISYHGIKIIKKERGI